MDLKLKEMIDSTEELADVIAEQIPGVDTDFGENFKLEMAKFITSAALHGKMKRDALKSLLRETVAPGCTNEGKPKEIDIDAYAFLLNANEKVRKESDLVFFGNTSSEKAVCLGTERKIPAIDIEPNRIPRDVAKVTICFSVYDDHSGKNLSSVKKPCIQVFDKTKELFWVPFGTIEPIRTIVAVQFYRRNGEWRMNAVANGYNAPLSRLCQSYGLTVQ